MSTIERETFYANVHAGSVPTLVTLALRASLTTAASDTLAKIVADPVLVRRLADKSMLPYMVDLYMNRGNHTALHHAPVARRYEFCFALFEDNRGEINGFPVLTPRELIVEIVEAKDLPSSGKGKKKGIRPFVTVTAGENIVSTQELQNPNDRPRWNAEMTVRVLGSTDLLVEMNNRVGASKQESLGEVRIPLPDGEGTPVTWYPLAPSKGCSDPKGELSVACRWACKSGGLSTCMVDRQLKDIELTKPAGSAECEAGLVLS